ncbi:putative molybdopterin-binding oxidoreductase [Nocardia nova SH22a]|uniref:Putative molybdopterin-binding oxidoreductase n=1 Tax=Nocardia nova SH22a TaxID=1415166 RepID=W5TLC6_9NOCA|nr:molybdopterin-dependent oxidoreductase [Nocardia nova]AHH19768.1 putative molybdopterin-binding oxidoreductase [Nocardia nova SH22a]
MSTGDRFLLPGAIATRISPARSPAVAARIGIAIGVTITICFVTGLISHWIQHPPDWFRWPAHPVWLYRVTQGTHVISGVITIPLVLVKLWSVYPRLFARPAIGGLLRLAERGSIAVLVAATLFQLATGLFNIAQFYAWRFFFTTTHYAMAYVAFGALAVHLAVKLPVVRSELARGTSTARPAAGNGSDSSASATDSAAGPHPAAREQAVSRRVVLGAAIVSAGLAGLSVAGQSVPWLRRISVLAPRSGAGPLGVPVNRTAAQASVTERALDPDYRLAVTVPGGHRTFSRAELAGLPQTTVDLPISCVEGWSVSARWSGVRLRDLLAAVGDYRGGAVGFRSLEPAGLYSRSTLPHDFAVDAATLIALRLNGTDLDVDHGFPCRLIAPDRPGVLQTKWLSAIEVLG